MWSQSLLHSFQLCQSPMCPFRVTHNRGLSRHCVLTFFLFVWKMLSPLFKWIPILLPYDSPYIQILMTLSLLPFPLSQGESYHPPQSVPNIYEVHRYAMYAHTPVIQFHFLAFSILTHFFSGSRLPCPGLESCTHCRYIHAKFLAMNIVTETAKIGRRGMLAFLLR